MTGINAGSGGFLLPAPATAAAIIQRPGNPSSGAQATMDATHIELKGSRITAVGVDGDRVRIRFEPAYLIKSMTGSQERTKWRQNGELVFADAELVGAVPPLPAECEGGDVGENVYTYRDMVPVPLDSRGRAHCALKLVGGGMLEVRGTAVRLSMEDVPKYIEHLRPA
ncbi:MAG: hypothetical protein RLZ44_1002 [Pseudomonadota bacterium]